MKVCIPCQSPGGPDAVVNAPFEESEMLDYYEVHEDGNFDLVAQMRSCLGGCSDPVEAVTRRGVEVIVVTGISPRSLMLFRNAGIKVLRADSPAVRSLIDSLHRGALPEIGVDESRRKEGQR
jgi:predicted Fe-Mo cluster-binding NifX family protein